MYISKFWLRLKTASERGDVELAATIALNVSFLSRSVFSSSSSTTTILSSPTLRDVFREWICLHLWEWKLYHCFSRIAQLTHPLESSNSFTSFHRHVTSLCPRIKKLQMQRRWVPRIKASSTLPTLVKTILQPYSSPKIQRSSKPASWLRLYCNLLFLSSSHSLLSSPVCSHRLFQVVQQTIGKETDLSTLPRPIHQRRQRTLRRSSKKPISFSSVQLS